MEEIKLSDDVFEQIKNFGSWCRLTEEQKSLIDKLILNEELKKRYIEYGLCKECKQPNTSNMGWCQQCNAKRFQQNFKNWTSGNHDVDKFIQKTQLEARNFKEVIEWVDYDRFENVEYLARGGFGTIYKAIWKDGPIESWDNENNQWERSEDYPVALKCLHGLQDITAEFLREIESHVMMNNAIYLVHCYGITKDPKMNNFMMIMNYAKNGSLRKYLNNSFDSMNWNEKLNNLQMIAHGLSEIHCNRFIHCDFHCGNILSSFNYSSDWIWIYITDLGLCQPENQKPFQSDNNKKMYGVLPYVAPEVLRGNEYTQASDIYGFGVIAYEVCTGLPPYNNGVHDEHLAIKICRGLRPNSNYKVPQLILDIIKQCWDADPLKRPKVKELEELLWNLYDGVNYDENSIINKQIKEADEINKNLSASALSSTTSISYTTHPQAVYTSRLIDFKNLPDPTNVEDSESRMIDVTKLHLIDINPKEPLVKKDAPTTVETGNAINRMTQKGNSNTQKYIKYIIRKYPTKKEREKETELNISKQNLGGHLDLSDFINLEKLDCSDNQLTSLDISKNMQLVELDCSYNRLINIKFPASNKIEDLNLLDNQISLDLSSFSHFINIKKLFIGNTDEDRIKQGIYNQFHGSLEPLRNLTKLENLSINNTDIDSGLEYLPDSIKIFRCLADERPEAKVREIYDQLETFATVSIDTIQGKYNLKAWKENWKLVKEKGALQKQLNTQTSQMEELIKEITLSRKEEIDAELAELGKQKKGLLAEKKELMTKKVELEQDLEILEKEAKTREEDLKAPQQQVDKLKSELERSNIAYQEGNKARLKLEEKERKFQSFTDGELMEKELLQKKANDLRNELLIKERVKEELEEKLREKLKIKKVESEDLQKQINQIETSITTIKNKKIELDHLKKKLDGEKLFSRNSTAGLRKQMSKFKDEINSKRKIMEEARQIRNELKEVEKNEKNLQEEKNQLQNLLGEHQKNEQIFQDKIVTFEIELKDKEAHINELQQKSEQQIDKLKGQLKETTILLEETRRNGENLQNEKNHLQNLLVRLQIQTKEAELKGLISTIHNTCDLGKPGKRLLEKLLDVQKNLVLSNSSSTPQNLEEIKQELSEDYDLTKEKIDNLLNLQTEITRLNVGVKSLPDQEQQYKTLSKPASEKLKRQLNEDEMKQIQHKQAGDTLRNYLKDNFPSLKLQDKYRLALQLSIAIECLHKKGIVHNDLHSNNIFIQQNSIKLADFELSERPSSFDIIPYIDPEGFDVIKKSSDVYSLEGVQVEKYKLNDKSDVYSIGVLFWELSSGQKPFADKEYNLFLATEIKRGLRENVIEGTPEEYSNLYTKCWNGDPDKRPTIQEVIITLKSMMSSLDLEPVKSLSSKQQIIQQFKLNHGLFLDGYCIKPSKQAVVFEDGELNISLYKGQPLVYTFINNRNSHTNLLNFNSKASYELNENLQPTEVCIDFPVAEITYNANLTESFSNFMDDDEALCEIYGHLFAKKFLIGGKLFIDDFKSATSTQIDIFKSLLTWTYDSAKYNKSNPFNYLSVMKFFPKITTLNGQRLDTPESLSNWMNNLYQKDMADIISYNNLIAVSELRLNASSEDAFHEKQPGVANFREKLSLEEWVGDSIYVNLTRWVKKFRLLQGLIINERFELENSKEISVDLINIPNVGSNDESYLKMIKPATNLEEFFISNNMDLNSSFSVIKGAIKSDGISYGDKSRLEMVKPTINLDTIPIIKKNILSKNLNYGTYTYFTVKFGRYKISLTKDDVKPSEKFKQAIEKALESMRPFASLQDVFDEYGHFFPLSFVLGKSLKNILPNSSFPYTFKRLDLESPTVESLKSHLDKLNISYLLTQKGDIVKANDSSNWFQNVSNDLEIIEFGNIISLYDILEAEQRKNIDTILDMQDDFKIIMTGIDSLKDLDDNNTEHFKRINLEPTLEDENYIVFGSIISENNLKIEDFFVTFGLYDFNGFSVMINKNKLLETNVNIKECYILWIIIGKPLKLSVFSPNNRDCQVDYFKKSIVLQPDRFNYYIETPFLLSQGHTVSINARCATNYELINIKLSKDRIDFQIVRSPNLNIICGDDFDDTDLTNVEKVMMDIHICILLSNSKSLKIDNKEKIFHLSLIGYTLSNLS